MRSAAMTGDRTAGGIAGSCGASPPFQTGTLGRFGPSVGMFCAPLAGLGARNPGEKHAMSTITATAPAAPKPLYASLFVQVLAGLVLGIVLGMAAPDFAVSLKILSDAFLKLISMIVAPIDFCVVVHGIAGAGGLKKVGRVGVKALL